MRYKKFKISLFHIGFGLKTKVTMGHLICAFLGDKYPYQPAEAPSLIYRKPAKKLVFDNI